MPDLTFVLPHWLYWAGVALFPVMAMILVRRQRGLQTRAAVSMPLAYMLWLPAVSSAYIVSICVAGSALCTSPYSWEYFTQTLMDGKHAWSDHSQIRT